MADLPETENYDAGVYQIETTDAVVGGAGGKSNAAAINLANRTKWLKARVDELIALAVQATESALGIAEIATQVEVNAGTDDERIVTPLKLRSGFSMSLAGNGYVVFPAWLGGWVIQWGSAAANSSGRATGSWPMTFPAALYVAVGVGSVGATSNVVHAVTRGTAASASQYDFWLSSAIAHTINYIAIGK